MRVLLDNCVHRHVRRLLPGHDVRHTSEVGWAALRNGELIARAARQFDVFVTTDKKIRHEQNLLKAPLPIVELNSLFTRFDDLKAMGPFLELALAHTRSHLFVSVKPDGSFELLAPRP